MKNRPIAKVKPSDMHVERAEDQLGRFSQRLKEIA